MKYIFLKRFQCIFLNESFIIFICKLLSEALYFLDDAETTIPVLIFFHFLINVNSRCVQDQLNIFSISIIRIKVNESSKFKWHLYNICIQTTISLINYIRCIFIIWNHYSMFMKSILHNLCLNNLLYHIYRKTFMKM